MSADFILKRGNVWYFNMRVPDDARGHFGENQWRYSLKTKDRQEAIKLARQEAATKDQQIAQARTAMAAPARKWQYSSIKSGLPPLKWSSAMFSKPEETHDQQATKTRRDCHEVTAG